MKAAPVVVLVATLAAGPAVAQEEFPPPSGGKAPLVMVLSGATGPGNYRAMAGRIAALGYDVALFDSNAIMKTPARAGRTIDPAAIGSSVREAIARARQLPHALPGKIGMVGFSLGGGLVLGYGSMWTDDVAAVAAWYPSTSEFKDTAGFASRIKVPVVMFAGTADEYHFCCMIDKARALESAAKAANAPFELTVYPGVRHGFNLRGADYDGPSTEDAFAKTAAALKRYLGR